MLGSVLRAGGAWVAATALIMFGVDAAIERVADDVTITRPAPLTSSEVGRQLHGGGPPATTTSRPELTPPTVTTSPSVPVATTVPVTSTGPVGSDEPSNGPGEPHEPDATGPEPSGGPPAGAGRTTSTPRTTTGHPDEHQQPRGP